MADLGNQQGNTQQNADPSGNPIHQMGGNKYTLEQSLNVIAHILEQNPNALNQIFKAPTQSQSNFSKNKWTIEERHSQPKYKSKGNLLEDFEAGIKDQLLDSLAGGSFKKSMQNALDVFAKEFGTDLRDLPHEFGKKVASQLFDKVSKSELGKDISKGASNLGNSMLKGISKNFQGGDKFADSLRKAANSFFKNKSGGNDFISKLMNNGGGKVGSQNADMASNAMKSVGGDFGPPAGEVISSGQAGSQVAGEAASQVAGEAAGQVAGEAAGQAGSVVAEGAATAVAGGAGSAAAEGVSTAAVGAATAEAGTVAAEGAAAGAGTVAAEGAAAGAGTVAAGGGLTAVAATGYGALIIAIIYTIYKILQPALESLADTAKALGKAWVKEEEMRKKRIENARKRLESDMEWMAKRPFEILEEAAKEWESTWDSTLRTIGQTQGYDKSSVYSLYEGYAAKLQEEGLGAVVSATDIISKLTSVLDAGLSGLAAEEFAYEATKLQAAIPTQDFFGYVDTYASIAANAIAQGKSQTEAIAEANAQLEQFASNLLYSSRELSGGFSTGLKNSANLFKEAVQIAQSAKTDNAAAISGTLTSVSAIIGAVAPDLADSLVSNVVQAAIGGNSNTIVALRSLAGINAGNTDFLREMAEDPQKIFSSLFSKLAELQNMSPDNYMEVAEGLADVFGIDKAAFARVDFNYLAQAIDSMNVNNSSLSDNLDLLVSGQTTTSEEQLRAQEINKVILEEGLAYVIDSEAGRMVQQHMWEEQETNALLENEYAVNLQGRALELLESLKKVVMNILDFFNPGGFFERGFDGIITTLQKADENDEDLKTLLELGRVGSNSRAYYNLTTRGEDLGLTTSLVEMMGGTKSNSSKWDDLRKFNHSLAVMGSIGTAITTGGASLTGSVANYTVSSAWNTGKNGQLSGGNWAWTSNDYYQQTHQSNMPDYEFGTSAVTTRYNWSMVGKSLAKAFQEMPSNYEGYSKPENHGKTADQVALEKAQEKVQAFLDDLQTNEEKKSNTKLTLTDWLNSAKEWGISNIEDALSDFGISMEEVSDYFQTFKASQGANIEENRKKDEELFRNENRGFWDYDNGTNGVFESAIWLPFFGDGQKYDTRMDAVESGLSTIQAQLGNHQQHTVISGIEELSRKLGDDSEFTVISILESINSNINDTFVISSSTFQQCLADWMRYIAESQDYTKTISKSQAWQDYRYAEADQQTEATLALANALQVFSAEELQKMDPQLQTNALLGEIVIILQAIMQQTNTPGGLNLIDTISALGLGMTSTNSSSST